MTDRTALGTTEPRATQGADWRNFLSQKGGWDAMKKLYCFRQENGVDDFDDCTFWGQDTSTGRTLNVSNLIVQMAGEEPLKVVMKRCII